MIISYLHLFTTLAPIFFLCHPSGFYCENQPSKHPCFVIMKYHTVSSQTSPNSRKHKNYEKSSITIINDH